MTFAITVEEVSKSYLIKHKVEQPPAYRTLRDTITEGLRGLPQRLRTRALEDAREELFWALRDVSFTVDHGERIGIIGANGAGKSTMLKILSRVTEPTRGRVTINGRVASLLEVGTGFHPELTGRENIYLNGVILGMSRREVWRRFDEIVAFAEVERFLDTPVKRYSSGMYVRLAFAVAAHLDPEVLILDEVLAVGDQRFQRKCFGKIQGMGSTDGRTILFVSHNMPAVRSICSKAILLEEGRVTARGRVDEVISAYESDARNPKSVGRIDLRRCVSFGVKLDDRRIGKPIKLAVSLRSSDGLALANMIDKDSQFGISSAARHEAVMVVLRDIRFYPGTYFFSLWVGSRESETWDYVHDCLTLEIMAGGELTQRSLPREAGLLFLTPEWARI